MISASLYRLEDDVYHPTSLAGGPWSVDAQHGGPPCALMAHLAERRVAREYGAPDSDRPESDGPESDGPESDGPESDGGDSAKGDSDSGEPGNGELQPVRLSVDLFRAVPMKPLAPRVEVVRRGRRLVVIDVALLAEQRVVARASVLFLRTSQLEAYDPESSVPKGPDGLATVPMISETLRTRMPPGFHFEVEVRWVESSDRPVAWIRMPMSVVAGENTSAFERAAALSDFANALGSRGRWKGQPVQVGFINTDCSLYLSRLPRGEWLGFHADRISDRDGVGTVEVALYDRDGRCGRVVQARLANDRPPGMRDGESVRD